MRWSVPTVGHQGGHKVEEHTVCGAAAALVFGRVWTKKIRVTILPLAVLWGDHRVEEAVGGENTILFTVIVANRRPKPGEAAA